MANQYDIRADQIARNRGLLDALSQQAFTPNKGQMVGQVYVGPGLLDAMTRPLEVLASQYGQGKLDTQAQQNEKDRQSALVQELQGYMGGGQPAAAPAGVPNPDGTSSFAAGSQAPINQVNTSPAPGMAPAPAPASGLNPTAMLSSQFPEVQGMGQKLLLHAMTQKPETFTPQVYTDPQTGQRTSVLQGSYGTQKPNTYGAPPTENKVSSGGEVYDPYAVQPGDKLAIRPPSMVNVVNTQEGARSKTLGQDEAKQIITARQQGMDAQKTFMTADRLQALDEKGIFSGPLAKPAEWAGQLATNLGIPMSDELKNMTANSENFNQTIGREITNMILSSSGVGRGFTDTDRDYVLKNFPNWLQSPQGRANAIQYLKDASVRGLEQSRQIEDAVNKGTVSSMDFTGGRMAAHAQSQGYSDRLQNSQGQAPGFDYNAIPAGSVYQAPDGQWRRKP